MDIASTAKGRMKAEKMIKDLATKRLPFARVMDVKVKPDVDIDGYPIPDGRKSACYVQFDSS